MTYTPATLVEVHAWGQLVGATAWDPRASCYAFEYDDDWIEGGRELAPLHMPNAPGPYVFPDLDETTFYRLPALLADALPDRFGNALVDAWMAAHNIPPTSITSLDRLVYTADRGMGALSFRPPTGPPADEITSIQLADLVSAARGVLRGDVSDGDTVTRDALSQLIQVGTSAGGARAKAVVAFNQATGQIRSGQLGAPADFEPWLIKLDGVTTATEAANPFADSGSYGTIEYAYHLMATAAGITMSECQLLPEGPRTHFLTRRFDRTVDGGRLHLATLCALAHLDFNMADTHSYSQYMNTIDQLGLGDDARAEAFRRVTFNVAAVNRDDHTKNLSFLMTADGTWDLAPAYDVIHSHNPDGARTRRHQMSVEGKFEAITVEDLRAFADRHEVPGYNQIIAEVTAAVADWPTFAARAGVPTDRMTAIADDLAAHRLA